MMQDSFDTLSLHTGQEPDLMLDLGNISPRMLSPADEMNNPFLISTTGSAVMDRSAYSTIKGAPGSVDAQKRHQLFTPLDLSWFSFLNDSKTEGEQTEDAQGDYFSLATSLNRQRRSPSPTHYSVTSSHNSCASSSPPSESGSEFFDQANHIDFEVESLELPMASFALPSLHEEGMQMGMETAEFRHRYSSSMMPASEVTIRSHRKTPDGEKGLQSIMSLNTFNLSDFISDHHEQDNAVGMQNMEVPLQQSPAQRQLVHAMDLSSSTMATPDRPLYHRNVRSLTSLNDPAFSPMSTMSPLGLDHPHIHDFRTDQHDLMSKQMMDSSALYSSRPTQDYFTNRPKLPLRVYSNPLESLSCNPAQITPGQEVPPMEPSSEDGSCFFSSSSSPSNSGHGDNYELRLGGGDEVAIQPPTPYGYGTDGYSNLWTLAKSDAHPRDVFEGHSSPLFGQEHRLVKLNHPSAASSMYIEDQKRLIDSETQYGLGLQGIPKRGSFRSSRLTSLSNSRQSASPYQSPVLDQARLESELNGTRMTIGGQVITGIITKRSRGRRVPNNPEELNNLGKSGKVYTCKVPGCGKCFKRSEHLKRHVRSIHTNEKPFTCHCGKTFSRHDNLNQHARVHGTENSPASLPASISPPGSPISFPASSFGSPIGGSRRASAAQNGSHLRQIDYYEHDDEKVRSAV